MPQVTSKYSLSFPVGWVLPAKSTADRAELSEPDPDAKSVTSESADGSFYSTEDQQDSSNADEGYNSRLSTPPSTDKQHFPTHMPDVSPRQVSHKPSSITANNRYNRKYSPNWTLPASTQPATRPRNRSLDGEVSQSIPSPRTVHKHDDYQTYQYSSTEPRPRRQRFYAGMPATDPRPRRQARFPQPPLPPRPRHAQISPEVVYGGEVLVRPPRGYLHISPHVVDEAAASLILVPPPPPMTECAPWRFNDCLQHTSLNEEDNRGSLLSQG